MALVIDSLTIKRGERTIVSGLSLAAREGEALLLTGANGAGKTTLLRTIAGLLQAAAGSIRLEWRPTSSTSLVSSGSPVRPSGPALPLPPWGEGLGVGGSSTTEGYGEVWGWDQQSPTTPDVHPTPDTSPSRGGGKKVADAAAMDADVAEHCHFVGHLNGVKPALTVAENCAFWARYLGGDGQGIKPALEAFRMADLAPIRAGYLSAGQKRRLGLARLLLAPRPVWLLDEPAVSLDVASQGLLAAAVNAHLADGGIVIAATHQPLGFAPAREHRLGGGATASLQDGAAAP